MVIDLAELHPILALLKNNKRKEADKAKPRAIMGRLPAV